MAFFYTTTINYKLELPNIAQRLQITLPFTGCLFLQFVSNESNVSFTHGCKTCQLLSINLQFQAFYSDLTLRFKPKVIVRKSYKLQIKSTHIRSWLSRSQLIRLLAFMLKVNRDCKTQITRRRQENVVCNNLFSFSVTYFRTENLQYLLHLSQSVENFSR
jgi:hypothetical protein